MFTKEQLNNIVRNKIESDEVLGDRAGGSGHMSNVSYDVDKIDNPVKIKKGWKIFYEYTTSVITEFTIWPDNPPYESRHSKYIIVNDSGEIIGESDKDTKYVQGGGGFDFDPEVPDKDN